MKSVCPRNICTVIFIFTLFAMAKILNKPVFFNRQMYQEMWCLYTCVHIHVNKHIFTHSHTHSRSLKIGKFFHMWQNA
jgi:hypothetical protein